MPELPEVEHFRRLLLPLVSSESKLRLELIVDEEALPRKFLSAQDVESLNAADCFVKDVLRKGKLIAIALECKKKVKGKKAVYLFVHMGMTGRISTKECVTKLESLPETDFPPPSSYLKFQSEGGKVEVVFSDPRKFGSITLSTSLEDGFGPLATDALEVTDASLFANQRLGIKALLLDQKRVLSGVGNWVADEVLYQCRVHPEQAYLTDAQSENLLETLHTILNKAIDCLGRREKLPEDWLFHCRWGKKNAKKGEGVKDPEGRAVVFHKVASRTSAIVPSIQEKKDQKPSRKDKKTSRKDKKPSRKEKKPSSKSEPSRKKRPSRDPEEPAASKKAKRRKKSNSADEKDTPSTGKTRRTSRRLAAKG